MARQTFTIPNISCGHCVNAIQSELSTVPGVTAVTGDPAAKTVAVDYSPPATEAAIRSLLEEISYPAE